MKNTISSTTCIALISLYGLCTTSCSDNSGGNKASTDSISKNRYHKITAKERLAKNNELDHNLNWDSEGLKGKVKTITTIGYKLSENGAIIYNNTKSIDTFDTNGNMVKCYSLTKEGKINSSTEVLYDANNIDRGNISRDALGKITGRSAAKYDSRGNQTEIANFDADGKFEGKKGFKYDNSDNLIELDIYVTNDSIWIKRTFTYDEHGFKTGGMDYNGNGKGKPYEKYTCKNDTAGHAIYVIITDANDSASWRVDTLKHDDKGNITENDGYDNKGNLISKYVWTYDEHGRKTSSVTYKVDGSIDESSSSFEKYVYDTVANNIKTSQYKLKDGKKALSYVTEKAIVYY